VDVTNNRHINHNLGKVLKQQRVTSGLTLRALSVAADVSSSHLGRIERGERFPSAHILRRLARPLGFDEGQLFALAGYLPPKLSVGDERVAGNGTGQLDPLVSRMLAEEPVEVQRSVVAILAVLKSVARSTQVKY